MQSFARWARSWFRSTFKSTCVCSETRLFAVVSLRQMNSFTARITNKNATTAVVVELIRLYRYQCLQVSVLEQRPRHCSVVYKDVAKTLFRGMFSYSFLSFIICLFAFPSSLPFPLPFLPFLPLPLNPARYLGSVVYSPSGVRAEDGPQMHFWCI